MRVQGLIEGEVFRHKDDPDRLWIVRRVSPGAAYVERLLPEPKEVTLPDGRTFTARSTGGTVAIAVNSFVDRVDLDPDDAALAEAIRMAHRRTAKDNKKQDILRKQSKPPEDPRLEGGPGVTIPVTCREEHKHR